MADQVVRCGPREVPSAAEVESLYYAATCGSPLHESRATAAGYARLYAALLRRPDLEAVAARDPHGQLAGFTYGHGWRWAEQADDWAAQLKERLAGAADRLDGRFAVYLLAVHPVAPPGRPGPAADGHAPFRNENRRVADYPG